MLAGRWESDAIAFFYLKQREMAQMRLVGKPALVKSLVVASEKPPHTHEPPHDDHLGRPGIATAFKAEFCEAGTTASGLMGI